jgi:hypothetical protein
MKDEWEERAKKRRRAASQARRKILFEVGRTIVALSNIENWVSSLYHDYCETLSSTTSMEIFHAQGGIEKKIKLTNLIVEMRAETQHQERWQKIIGGFDKARLVRNLIAHYGLYVDPIKDKPAAYLSPPWLKFTKDGRRTGAVISLAEVRAAADALEKIEGELEAFWNDLQDYWYPPDKDDEVF